MSSQPLPSSPPRRPPLPVAAVGALLALLAVAAYHNTFGIPFVFDDVPSIVENRSIRSLWPLSAVLFPDQAGGITTSGRPVVNLSLALNHAWGGERVAGYHAVNLALHLAAGLCLFGLVRRTLLLPRLAPRWGRDATWLAAGAAALWLLHPLQTAAVTYVVQRAEVIAGCLFLLTLYASLRGSDPATGGRWRALAVGACLLGMASKEVMVSAPLVVLLFDRLFLSPSLGAALRGRPGFYAGLAATWLVLVVLVLGTGGRGGTAGFGSGVSPWEYGLTQCRAVFIYLARVGWPHGLVFDYGLSLDRRLAEVWPQALGVVGLVAAVGWGLRRWSTWAVGGVVLLALLAPTTSFIPIATQTMAEHRLYLPLAVGAVAAVVGLHALVGPRRAAGAVGAVALALGLTTIARNEVYRTEVSLWTDAAAHLPGNARAHNNLGQALFRAGRVPDAIRSYRQALALQPKYPESHYNLGVALAHLGQTEPAIEHYETALRLQPDYPEAMNNLANTLGRSGRTNEALRLYEAALARRPDFAEAHNNLGNALLQAGRLDEARARFERALQLRPGHAETLYNLGNALAAGGDMTGALARFEAALRADPRYAAAQVNAGNALLELRRPLEALARYEAAVAADPGLADAHFNRGSVLLDLGRWSEAVPAFEAVRRLAPGKTAALRALAYALAQAGRATEAVDRYQEYLVLRPDDTEARTELQRLREAAAPVRLPR
ncbi:MAG: tetratricopeptide repeat protein [Verrucomicrobia bacterium]|nr:tetratricopeptide repeat protein [Verrucomicrobiota bacterium]